MVFTPLDPDFPRNHKPWTAEEIALLGNMSDASVAVRTGRKKNSVKHKRRRLEITPFGFEPGTYPERKRWTEKEIALLGTMPDSDVSSKTGRTLNAVREKRLSLRIPFWRKPTDRSGLYMPKEYLPLVSMVKEETLLALLGLDNPYPLRGLIRSMGLRRFCIWTPELEEMLYHYTSVKFCHLTGLRYGTVRKKRYRLGITSHRKFLHDEPLINEVPMAPPIKEVQWSLPLLMRLGSTPDKIMASAHAVPIRFSRAKRAELELWYEPRWTYDAHLMIPYVPVNILASLLQLSEEEVSERASILGIPLAPPLSGEAIELPSVFDENKTNQFVRDVRRKKQKLNHVSEVEPPSPNGVETPSPSAPIDIPFNQVATYLFKHRQARFDDLVPLCDSAGEALELVNELIESEVATLVSRQPIVIAYAA